MKKLLRIGLAAFVLFAFLSIAQAADYVTATISSAPPAAGTWTDGIAPALKARGGFLSITISGTWVATVTLQCSTDAGVTYSDVDYTWTSNIRRALVDPEAGVRYRIGVKNGDYTSGSVIVRLGRMKK